MLGSPWTSIECLRTRVLFQLGISREKELKYLRICNEHGVGIPLLASFNNGMVTALSTGKTLDDPSMIRFMVDPDFSRLDPAFLTKPHASLANS